MRLNRFLAAAGLGSRRGVEKLIEQGKVRVNGVVIAELATSVEPTDVVKVGNRVVHVEHTIHAVLNKPPGYICSADDEQERRTIYDLLPPNWPRVFHVGRLDMESEGLLILTNDGDLSLALTHPKYKVPKEYEVVLDKPFDPAHSAKLLKGFHIIGGRAKMESIQLVSGRRLRLVLHQGIKRQIRLMMYEMGYEVEQLKRVRIGSVVLGDIPPGGSRLLTPEELESLRLATSPAGAKAPVTRAATTGFMDLRPHNRRGTGPEKREKAAPPADVPAPREVRSGPTGDRPTLRGNQSSLRGGDRPAPRGDRPAPRGDRPAPRGDRRAPRGDRRAPRGDRPAPRGDRPAPRGDRPAPRGDRPAPRGDRPASRGGPPAPRGENRPAPRGGDRRPPRGDQPSARGGDRPALRGVERPNRRGGDHPAPRTQPPHAGTGRSDSAGKKPGQYTRPPAQRPWKRDESSERPPSRTQRPASRDSRPAPRGDRPSPRPGRAPSGNVRPASSSKRPGGRSSAKPSNRPRASRDH